MNFAECFASFSKSTREGIIRHLANFGDPVAVAEYINLMPVCYHSEKLIVWVDSNFIAWFKADSRELYVNTTNYFTFCSHIKGFGCKDEVVLLTLKGEGESLLFDSEADSVGVYNTISLYVNGFDNHDTIKRTGSVKEIQHCNFGTLIVTDEIIIAKNRKHLSNDFYEKPLCSSNQDIIWCRQLHIINADGSEDSQLVLYLMGGKIVKINFSHNYDAFKLALTLKKYVPHLLYGPGGDYLRIFQRKADELMSIAKGRLVSSQYKENDECIRSGI